jgi:methylmalonyl-CoA/ethylmalonyl-CoA epimerase
VLSGFHSVDLAVADLDAALAFYRDVLGLEQVTDARPSGRGHALRWVELGVGAQPCLSLLQPTGDGPVRRFLDQRGPGVFQVCFDTADVTGAAATLRERGIEPVGDGSRSVFVHPRDAHGALIELMPGAQS